MDFVEMGGYISSVLELNSELRPVVKL